VDKLKWKCDKCDHEFELDDFPDDDFKCPGCGDSNGTFTLTE
jgi:rubrerythrin